MTIATAPRSLRTVTRRSGPAGAIALAALTLVGCGSGADRASVATTPPAAFVDGVRELVRPAERMGVIATAALAPAGAQASPVEVDGLVSDAARELREFGALRPGAPALVAEQARLVRAMQPIVLQMRRIRSILRDDARPGLPAATSALLESLGGIPSAAQP